MSRLRLTETSVSGCKIIEPRVFEDHRGSFMEAFNEADFKEAGLPTHWPQDNIGISNKNVIRGLHIQRKNPQGKLVRCVRGALFDVCLDLRRDSPTYGKWHAETLFGAKSMYCPPGTAHGFLALQADSVIYYKCTTLYDGETDGGICPMDGLILPHWPIDPTKVILSEKDKKLPGYKAWVNDPLGVWNE